MSETDPLTLDRAAAQSAIGAEQPIVYVIDDDASVRDAMSSLVRSVRLRAKAFASAADLLEARLEDAPSCLVLDIRLPG